MSGWLRLRGQHPEAVRALHPASPACILSPFLPSACDYLPSTDVQRLMPEVLRSSSVAVICHGPAAPCVYAQWELLFGIQWRRWRQRQEFGQRAVALARSHRLNAQTRWQRECLCTFTHDAIHEVCVCACAYVCVCVCERKSVWCVAVTAGGRKACSVCQDACAPVCVMTLTQVEENQVMQVGISPHWYYMIADWWGNI